MSEALVTIAVGVAIAVGVTGTILPVLPGIPLVWAAILAYGLLLGFGTVGWVAVAASTFLAVVALVLAVRIPRRSAGAEGVSKAGQLLGLALAVAGFFLVPVVGAPLGFALGVWLHRLQATGDAATAWASTRRTLAALLRASLAQFACAVAMALTWALWVISG